MSDVFPPGSLNNDGDVLPAPADQTGSGATALFTATADATVGNTTTETTLFGSGSGSLTLSANYLTTGKTVAVRMWGYITTNVTPTFRLRLKLGSTVIADSVAVATPNIGATARPFIVDAIITCRTTGATGTVMAQVEYLIGGTASSLTVATEGSETNAAVTIDTTATQAVDLMATWGAANAQNTVTVTNACLLPLN